MLTTTSTMLLCDVEKIAFKKYKDLGSDRAAATLLFKDNLFYGFEIYSSVHGIANFYKGSLTCRGWENEEVVQDLDKLNKHYSGSFLNGEGDKLLAKAIMDDALEAVGMPPLTAKVLHCLQNQLPTKEEILTLKEMYADKA
jgi:hypothetical protein